MPDFAIWPDCNIGCVFCSNPVEGFRGTTEKYSYAVIARKILEYKAGHRRFLKFDSVSDYFNLTGGEPTLHPEFHRILALVRREFPGRMIRLLTNGRMFAYESFCERVFGIAQTPFAAAIPLFGHDARTHEATARAPGSFEQTVLGLRHALRHRRPGQAVEVRIILTRIQMKSLKSTLEFVHREFPEVDRVCLLFVELEGFAERYRNQVSMTMTECALGLDGCYEALSRLKEARLYHFPLCVLPERLWPFVYNTLDGIKVTSVESECPRCVYRRRCVGVHRSYLRHAGAPDIRAIAAPRAVRETGDRYHPFAADDKEPRPT